MLRHKTDVSHFKRVEIIENTFFDINGVKIETNIRKASGKFSNIWKLKISLLNNLILEKNHKKD